MVGPQDVSAALLRRYNLRVVPEMARYVAESLSAGSAGPISVIGGNARTGTPVRTLVDPQHLQQATQQQP